MPKRPKVRIGRVGGAKRLTEAVRKGLEDVRKGRLLSLEHLNDGGLKYDGYKSPLSLLPGRSLRAIGEVMAYGKIKYDAHNWRKGISHSRLLDAALRHLSSISDGDFIDEESGLRHLAHAATNLLFLLEMQETHPELNDLYKKNLKSYCAKHLVERGFSNETVLLDSTKCIKCEEDK